MTKPLRPNLGAGSAPSLPRSVSAAEESTPAMLSLNPSRSLPLEKYQSATRPAVACAAVELPPKKISGWARPATSTGAGCRVKSVML